MRYDVSEILKLIGKYIEPLKAKYGWGYNPAYFLTGQMNMHRSYAEYLLERELDIYDISFILEKVPYPDRAEYHKDVIERIYNDYLNNRINRM